MNPQKPLYWQNTDLWIAIYVQPKAKNNKVVGLYQDYIKVQIRAPAIENQANAHLIAWLAEECQVRQSDVILEKGQLSRYKLFRVKAPIIPGWLKQWLPKDN
jgi:uncharacterized protein (TIGR00251 family)